VVRWSQVEADDIGSFGRELWILALAPALSAAQIDFLLAQGTPDVLNVNIAQCFGNQWPVPARVTLRWRLVEDRPDALVGFGAVNGRGAGTRQILEPGKSFASEATSPQADRSWGCVELTGDVPRPPSLRRFQHDTYPQQLALLRGSCAQESLELRALFRGEMDLDCIRNHPDVESRRNTPR